MVRVEKVEVSNTARLHQLCQLIVEQTGPAQQAAQQLIAQMASFTQRDHADSAAEQLNKLSLAGEQQTSTHVPAAPKHDAAARFLRAIVSPQAGTSASTPINVQAMQVTLANPTLFGSSKLGSFSSPTTPRTHNPVLPSGLPSPASFNGHSHQQPSAYHNSSPLSFPHNNNTQPQHHRRPPTHNGNSYNAYNNSPLSVLSSLLTPRALHSMLAMNAGMLGVGGGVGLVDEPQRGRRRRVRKKKNRSVKAGGSGSSDAQQEDEQTAQSDDDNTDKEDDDSSEATDTQQHKQQQHTSATPAA